MSWDQHIKGTNGDDIINGGNGDDFIQGRAGGDTIDGGGGNDEIHGDSGDDHLKGSAGDDFINGGDGIDTAYYTGSIFEYGFSTDGENFYISHLAGFGVDGNDRLIHVERLVFADATIDLTQNNAPIAFDDTASTNEDVGTYSSGSASVLDNDFDWEGDSLSVTPGSFTGTYGTLVLNADGTYSYTPFASTQALAQGETVQDSFSYTVTDGSLSDTGTLTISIAGVNDAPVAAADTATGHENQILTIDVLANDDDVDNGAVLTVVAASGPAGKGTVSIVGNQVQFDPGTDFDHLAVGDSEIVVLNYTIEDEHGASSSSTVTVTVTGTNDGPVASPDTASAGENQTILIDVLANDDDVDDGAVLTVVAASAPANKGTASVVGNQVEFDPGTDFDHLADGATEVVVVSYTIEDEHGASSSSTISITVTGTNDGPVANPDTASAGENQTILVDVLANDDDVDDGAVLTVTAASAPANKGTASVVGNQVEFDPGTDFDHLADGATEVVVVSYTIEDEHGASSSSTISITVTGTNDGPVANPDTASAGENQTILVDVLANDDDVDDGAVLTVTAASAPANKGTASVVGNQVEFDPGTDFDHLADGATEVVVVSYTIEDEHGASSSSTISITVTGTNDGPVANPDTASAGENQTILVDVLANDDDVDDGAVLTVTAASAPANKGTASVVGNQVEFDPGTDFDHLADGATEVVVVSYTIEDEHGASSSSTISITVTGTNDGPVANPDTDSTDENVIVTIDVLANDTDVDDGAVLTVTAASAPSGQGSAAVVGNQVEFDPGTDFDYLAAGESVDVVINYSIEDEHGASSSSTVTVTVNGTNDAPTIDAGGTDASGSVTELPDGDANENTATHTDSGTIAFDDVDLSDTHSASFTPQGGSYLGTFTLDPVNQAGDTVGWDFSVSDAALDSLDEGEVVTQTYTVEIDDGNGGTVTQDVTITITGAADDPGPDGTNWYIDNSAVGSTNVGSQTNPFTSIAAFNAAQGSVGGPGVNDNVFLLTGTGTGIYAETDGINLLDGQVLTGIASGAVRPTIVTTVAGNHGVELAQNNTVSGLDIGATTGGAGIADGGGTVGTLTVSDVGKSGGGQIVDIDQGGTVSVTLNSAASTGSAGGAIDLAGLAGSFTVSGATTITGVHSNGGVDVTGSSLNVTFAGGGLVSTGTQIGVNFVGNTGSLSITGGGFDITTTVGRALNVETGGSVSISGAGNNILSTSGSAVVIRNATSSGVTLESVSSSGGSQAGIILENAGTGGFTVTGLSSTAASGGTIANKNAAAGVDGSLALGSGIIILGTSNVSLANMTLSGTFLNFGILGNNVSNFTLRDSLISGTFGNNLALNEGAVSFTGLTGTALLEGNTIAGGRADNLRIVNSSGSLNLTIQDSASDQAVFGLNNVNGEDSVYVETNGSASLGLVIDGAQFLGARSDMLLVAALGSSTQDIEISGTTFHNAHTNIASGGGGVVLAGIGATNINVDYLIENSSFQGASGTALAANYVTQTGSIQGRIENNVIGIGNGIAGSEGTSGGGSGISVQLHKTGASGTATYAVAIVDNEVYDIVQGIAAFSLDAKGGAAAGQSVLEVDMDGNIVDEMGDFVFTALYAAVGGTASSGDFSRLGLDMTNNVLDHSDADFGSSAVVLDQISTDSRYYFPGYAGDGEGELNGGTASADLDAFFAANGNTLSSGGFPTYPPFDVDASFLFGANGDPLVLPPWMP